MKRALALIVLAGFVALTAYFGIDLWNEQQLLRKLRGYGVQTDGVVTKLDSWHRSSWGTSYWIEYDYFAGGAKHHGRIGARRSPATYEGEHVLVTYVRDDPDASLPFGQRDLALADDPQGTRDRDLLVFVVCISLLAGTRAACARAGGGRHPTRG